MCSWCDGIHEMLTPAVRAHIAWMHCNENCTFIKKCTSCLYSHSTLYHVDGWLARISLTSSFLATSTAVKPSGFCRTPREFGQSGVAARVFDDFRFMPVRMLYLDVRSCACHQQFFDLRFVSFCAGHEQQEIHRFHSRFQQLVQPVVRSLDGKHSRVVEVVFHVVPVVILPFLRAIDSCGLRVGTQLLHEVEQRDDAVSVRGREFPGSSVGELVPGQVPSTSAWRFCDREAHRGGGVPSTPGRERIHRRIGDLPAIDTSPLRGIDTSPSPRYGASPSPPSAASQSVQAHPDPERD